MSTPNDSDTSDVDLGDDTPGERPPFADPVGDLLLQGTSGGARPGPPEPMENGPPETMENAAPGAPAEGEAETASPHAGVVLTTPAAATSPAPVQGPLLATGTTFEGTLAFDGRVVIAGTVRGDVVGDDLMELTETGEIRGNVEVGVAVIAGLVTGDLIATRAIELRSTARVKGDLTTPSMLVEKGAIFDGRCRMDTRPVVPDAARATAYTSTP